MANNKQFIDGRKLFCPVEAGSVSGSPVAVGSRGGVALTNRDAAGNATVDFKGVYRLPVTGITAVGTPVYYTANANPALRLGVVATALFFGYALEANPGGGLATLEVYVSEASGISQVAANTLEGTVVANVANANQVGGIPVLHRIDVADAATGDIDTVLTHKTRVIDAWAVKTAGAGGAVNTVQLQTGAAAAITDAMSINIADQAIARAGSIDDATHEIAAGGTLRVRRVKAGGNAACIVYVLGIRVA